MSTSERTEVSGPPPKKVVVAYDGSSAARHAIVDATSILGPALLLTVTVWEEGLAFVGSPMSTDGITVTPMVDPAQALGLDRTLHEHAERVSEEGAELARAHGAEAQPLAVPDDGNIANTILAVARDHNASAIVVGSRGLSGIRRRLEGSTSQKVLKHADCPVIVVHEPEGDDH